MLDFDDLTRTYLMTEQSSGGLRMTEDAVRDAEKSLAELTVEKPGANTIRKLNAAAYVGERYGPALVADWRHMRVALELIASDPGAEAATRVLASRIVGESATRVSAAQGFPERIGEQ